MCGRGSSRLAGIENVCTHKHPRIALDWSCGITRPGTQHRKSESLLSRKLITQLHPAKTQFQLEMLCCCFATYISEDCPVYANTSYIYPSPHLSIRNCILWPLDLHHHQVHKQVKCLPYLAQAVSLLGWPQLLKAFFFTLGVYLQLGSGRHQQARDPWVAAGPGLQEG